MKYLALRDGIGRLEDDGTLAVLDVPGTLASLLAAGGGLAPLRSARVSSRQTQDDVRFGSLTAPGAAVWGIGLNYRSKQQASGRSLPQFPTLFLKSPSAHCAVGDPIRIPPLAPDCVDYEGEIAVVLGTHLSGASPREAAGAVAAVAAANDVTARDVMRSSGNPTLAKSFPGFCPVGSAAMDPMDAGGFESLELTTTVNGELRQRDSGEGMIIPVDELLSLLSHYVTLRPGDVVLTGTPAGTGDETKTYLAHGDEIEVQLGGLPALRNRVVDPRSAAGGASGLHDVMATSTSTGRHN